MVNSRAKGCVGERELSKELTRLFGEECRRAQQYSGVCGDSDVLGLPGFFVEAKRVESLNVPKAVAKAVEQCPEGQIPIVCHRRNREPWLVTMELSSLPAAAVKLFQILAAKGT